MCGKDIAKALWGVAITVLTLLLAYGQVAIGNATLRPSLVLRPFETDRDFQSKHSFYSHRVVIESTGTTVAKDARITVLTRQIGQNPHEDNDKELGDLLPKELVRWAVYAHHVVENQPKQPKYDLTEEVTIRYRGESIFRFWCTPTYTYMAKFVYRALDEKWVDDPNHRPSEERTCE